MYSRKSLSTLVIIVPLLVSCAPKSTGDVFPKIQKTADEAYMKLRPVKLKMEESSLKMDLDGYKIEEKKFNDIAKKTLGEISPMVTSKGIKIPFEQKSFNDTFQLSNLIVKDVFFDNIQGNFMLKFQFDCTQSASTGKTQLVDISFLDKDGKLLIKQPMMIIRNKDKLDISIKIDERIGRITEASL
jgi:hypothetical protein